MEFAAGRERSRPVFVCGRTNPPFRKLFRSWEGVGEVVRVFAVGDDDVHGAGEAAELAGARVGDDSDGKMGSALRHEAAVLKKEGAGATLECAGDALDGDVNRGTFDGGGAGEHFPLASGLKIAVILFVDGHAAERVVFGLEGRIKRSDFDVERSGGVRGHECFLLR